MEKSRPFLAEHRPFPIFGFLTRLRSRSVPVLWALHPGSGKPVDDVARLSADTPAAKETAGADPDELHKLVTEHGDAVYRLALSVVRDSALAEDVAQDTMVKAWLALPTFRGDSSLRSWIMRIAHNTAISTLRTRRALVVDPNDLPERVTAPEGSVERRVENDEAMNDFVAALDLLDDLSRSIVVLREIEQMAYDEIARVLDVPLPTVKTRLLRARRRLSTALRGWE